jgi:hypothetical protein
METARRAFFTSSGKRFLEHFDFHRLAAQPALELPHTLFKLPGSADGHDVFIGFDGDLTALGT